MLSMKWCPILTWKKLCKEGLHGHRSSKIWARKTFESVAVCVYGARLSVFTRDWEAVQNGYSVYLAAGWDEGPSYATLCDFINQELRCSLDLEHVYIDGTKIEANANTWRIWWCLPQVRRSSPRRTAKSSTTQTATTSSSSEPGQIQQCLPTIYSQDYTAAL